MYESGSTQRTPGNPDQIYTIVLKKIKHQRHTRNQHVAILLTFELLRRLFRHSTLKSGVSCGAKSVHIFISLLHTANIKRQAEKKKKSDINSADVFKNQKLYKPSKIPKTSQTTLQSANNKHLSETKCSQTNYEATMHYNL